jgi:hypothetical protein
MFKLCMYENIRNMPTVMVNKPSPQHWAIYGYSELSKGTGAPRPKILGLGPILCFLRVGRGEMAGREKVHSKRV